jgi:hypothetical protein
VQNEIDTWQSSASENLQTALKNTLKERKLFSANLIELPSSLWSILPDAINLPWEEYLQKLKNNFNHLVEQFILYDKANNFIYQNNSLIVHTKFKNKFILSAINIVKG